MAGNGEDVDHTVVARISILERQTLKAETERTALLAGQQEITNALLQLRKDIVGELNRLYAAIIGSNQ